MKRGRQQPVSAKTHLCLFLYEGRCDAQDLLFAVREVLSVLFDGGFRSSATLDHRRSSRETQGFPDLFVAVLSPRIDD